MKQRCYARYSKSFPLYGGRDIGICKDWRFSFETFLADMGKRPSPNHSVERLDNNLGYSPENCVWATPDIQHRNKRSNKLITYNGETLCLTDWARRYYIDKGTLRYRILHGWSIEDALFTPPKQLPHS